MRYGTGPELHEASHDCLIRARHRVPLVDEAVEEALAVALLPARAQRQQRDGRCTKRDAVDSLEEACQVAELRLDSRAHHVGVEECRYGAAGGVPRDEEAAVRAGGIFLQEDAESFCDGGNHLARDVEEPGVAVIAWVVEEALWA